MITKLTNIELNVLAVALDHMEDHLLDLQLDLDDVEAAQNRLDAVKSLQTNTMNYDPWECYTIKRIYARA